MTIHTVANNTRHGAEGGKRVTDTDASRLPVRAGEDPWSTAELADVRSELEREVAELRAEIEEKDSELAEQLSDAVSGAGDDVTDTSAKAYQREHDLALAYNTRESLVQSERAIERINAGTYGECESCGQAIGKARLQAFPRATQCLGCKQREERR